MTKVSSLCGLVGLVLVCAANSVQAAYIPFEIGTNNAFDFGMTSGYGSVDAGDVNGNTDAGALLDVAFGLDGNLSNVAFGLTNPGDSFTFLVGTISFAENWINVLEQDDLDVTVILEFVQPTLNLVGNPGGAVSFVGTVNAETNSATQGSDYRISFSAQTISFGVGSSYVVDLSGLNGVDPILFNQTGTKSLYATVTLNNLDPQDGPLLVPEPTSLVILGSGVLGMLGYGFRRRKQAA